MNEPAVKADANDGQGAAASQDSADSSVKLGGKIVSLLILLSLAWYLASDRYTPYTTQARVQGYVIGVAPQVSGIVSEVYVSNNERVEAGQPIFRIDASQYEIALAKARSDYEDVLRQVEAGDAGVAAARANLLAAEAVLDKARKDTDRLERLYTEDPGTISTRRLEVSRATLAQSRASVSAAEAAIDQAIQAKGGASDEGNTKLRIARTGIDRAKLDLEHTVVTATDRGEVTDLRVDVGTFAAAGNPVLTLISLSDVWVQAEFTENNLGHIRPGTRVEILFDSLPGRVFAGEISNIGLGISSSQAPPPGTLPSIENDRDWLRQSQRFPVMVHFDVAQNDALPKQLRIGGQASVMAYGDGAWLTAMLARVYIRIMSFFSFAH